MRSNMSTFEIDINCKPLEKLIETVANGIGILYEPKRIKKKAEAKKHEAFLMADVLRQNIDIPGKYENEQITWDTSNQNELVKRTCQRFYYQELYKQQNIEAILDNAYDALENDEDNASPEPVEDNWLFSFFSSGGEICDEEMQILWGRILAGEIKEPKSFSLRTLATLKNLSQEEARLFAKACNFLCRHNNMSFLVKNEGLLYDYGLTYPELLKLDDCGLLAMKETTLNLAVTKNKISSIYAPKYIIIFSGREDQENKFKIPIYVLTTAGEQLTKLVDKINDSLFFTALAKNLSETHQDINCSLHEIIKYNSSGENIEYYLKDLLTK